MRLHGVEQHNEKLFWHRKRQMTVLLAESFEDGSPFGRRATTKRAERLRAIIFCNGRTDAARLAACAGTDVCGGGGAKCERFLIFLHELRRAGNTRKPNTESTAAEVVISAEALDVFEMQLGHFGFAFSFAISSFHAFAPAVSPVLSVSAALLPKTRKTVPSLATISIMAGSSPASRALRMARSAS